MKLNAMIFYKKKLIYQKIYKKKAIRKQKIKIKLSEINKNNQKKRT